MRTIKGVLESSSAELKSLRSLTLASFLAAIYAVSYSPVAGNFIIVPGVIEIRFGFIAIAVAAALFGPVMAALAAFIGDILGTLLFYGGSFFWGYTLTWIVMGLAFGLFFYKEKISNLRIILAMLFNTCVINMLFATICMQMMGFGTFEGLFITRLTKNIVTLPINTVLLILVLRSVCSLYKRMSVRSMSR